MVREEGTYVYRPIHFSGHCRRLSFLNEAFFYWARCPKNILHIVYDEMAFFYIPIKKSKNNKRYTPQKHNPDLQHYMSDAI